MQELLSKIKSTRKELGWSQAYLGSRIGKDAAWVSRVESGKLNPTFDSFYQLVIALRLKVLILPRHDAIAADRFLKEGTDEEWVGFEVDGDEEEDDCGYKMDMTKREN